MRDHLDKLESKSVHILREAYAARCDTIGRAVRVVVSDTESVEGEAVGVDEDGRLLVSTGDGVSAFAAGDVWHLR